MFPLHWDKFSIETHADDAFGPDGLRVPAQTRTSSEYENTPPEAEIEAVTFNGGGPEVGATERDTIAGGYEENGGTTTGTMAPNRIPWASCPAAVNVQSPGAVTLTSTQPELPLCPKEGMPMMTRRHGGVDRFGVLGVGHNEML
jgi:hypothetical protein